MKRGYNECPLIIDELINIENSNIYTYIKKILCSISNECTYYIKEGIHYIILFIYEYLIKNNICYIISLLCILLLLYLRYLYILNKRYNEKYNHIIYNNN